MIAAVTVSSTRVKPLRLIITRLISESVQDCNERFEHGYRHEPDQDRASEYGEREQHHRQSMRGARAASRQAVAELLERPRQIVRLLGRQDQAKHALGGKSISDQAGGERLALSEVEHQVTRSPLNRGWKQSRLR